jgi:aminoglycoside/choline kinase family phosphotransferase
LTSATSTLPADIAWADTARRDTFTQWLGAVAPAHGIDPASLTPASADASFRRYFRVRAGSGSFIIMDAPPPQEDVRPFVHIAGLIRDAGLHAPRVLECDAERGFLLLDDLGHLPYLQALKEASPERADALMRDATRALVQFQLRVDAASLPAYDEALLARELALFPDWLVTHEFGVTWTEAQRQQWDRVCRVLIDSALAQPVVAVHRDWMPRNLMVSEPNPGILDFQDAVRGPITYDLACLLRDAFISWDEALEIDWAVRWWDEARKSGLPVDEDFGEFWRQLEWMGLQRHLKVAGIFCRLKHRDGKPAYAADLPRFFDYMTKVALRYRPLQPLLPLIEPLSGRVVRSGYTF